MNKQGKCEQTLTKKAQMKKKKNYIYILQFLTLTLC